MKSFNLALLFAAVVSAAPVDDVHLGEFDAPSLPAGLPVVQYNGPTYKMKREDWIARAEAHANNQSWSVPADMPQITLEPGQILDLGIVANASISKRDGDHVAEAYNQANCGGNMISRVLNFGCGVACINVLDVAHSGLVSQQRSKGNYPTMDVWDGYGCEGNRAQHFGVKGTSSCTNSNNPNGFRSFVAWYGCHH